MNNIGLKKVFLLIQIQRKLNYFKAENINSTHCIITPIKQSVNQNLIAQYFKKENHSIT